jgi:hypothetical protein
LWKRPRPKLGCGAKERRRRRRRRRRNQGGYVACNGRMRTAYKISVAKS